MNCMSDCSPCRDPLLEGLDVPDAAALEDACSWLLSEDPIDPIDTDFDEICRPQRRRTLDFGAASVPAAAPPCATAARTISAPTSVFLTAMATPRPSFSDNVHPVRASCEFQLPQHPSLDYQHRACASLDVSRPPISPRHSAPTGNGVVSWLAAWGKLAEEQGCAVGTPPARVSCEAPRRMTPVQPLPPSRTSVQSAGPALAATSSFFCPSSPSVALSSAPGEPHISPFQAASLAPQAQPPRQPRALWSTHSSDISLSPPRPTDSPVLHVADECSGPAWRVEVHAREAPVPQWNARSTSMDGWSDQGGAAWAAQNHKRKRPAAVPPSTAEYSRQASCGAYTASDALACGLPHVRSPLAAQHLAMAQHRKPHHRASMDSRSQGPSGIATPSRRSGHLTHMSLDLSSHSLPPPAPTRPGGIPDLLPGFGSAAVQYAPRASLETEPSAGCFAMLDDWGSALPLELLGA